MAIASTTVEAGTAPPLFTEQAKLAGVADGSGDSTAFDAYGAAVALEGDVLVVGAPLDDVLGMSYAGSVYVYERSGASWTLRQRLVASDPAFLARFGFAVALSGDTLAVGAPNIIYNGAVYVFERVAGVWQERRRFNGGGFEDNFGASVALSGNTLVVGEPNADHTFGAAYVFVRAGARWSRRQRLSADFLPVFVVSFGAAVGIAGDTILVGAPSAGAVVLFRQTAGRWIEVGRLIPGDSAEGDGFGRALAVSGDTLVVGASPNMFPEIDTVGAAYVFVRSGSDWEEQQKLVDPEPASTSALGSAVAVLGDTALVGTQKFDAPRGSALVFDRTGTTWAFRQRIAASDGAKGDAFGASVALSGEDAVVGAPGANISGDVRAGAAYVLGPAGARPGRAKITE